MLKIAAELTGIREKTALLHAGGNLIEKNATRACWPSADLTRSELRRNADDY